MLPSIVDALSDSAHTENSLEIFYLLETKLIFQNRSLETLCIITNEEKGVIFLVVTEDHEKGELIILTLDKHAFLYLKKYILIATTVELDIFEFELLHLF